MTTIRLSTRKLVVGALYLSSAILSVINLSIYGHTFSVIDLALTIAGTIPWVIASVQSFYNKVQARRIDILRERNTEKDKETVQQITNGYRRSTHNTVNAMLHVCASTLYLASDLRTVSEASPQQMARIVGTSLWLSSAIKYGILAAKHERQLEENPETNVNACGLSLAMSYLTCDLEYLIAGFLYASAIYSSETLLPLKVAGNACWLFANAHEVIRQSNDILCAPKKKTPIP